MAYMMNEYPGSDATPEELIEYAKGEITFLFDVSERYAGAGELTIKVDDHGLVSGTFLVYTEILEFLYGLSSVCSIEVIDTDDEMSKQLVVTVDNM